MKRYWAFLAAGLLAIACAERAQNLAGAVQSSTVEWWMLDVSSDKGQADAHLLRFASGKTVLVDAGEAGDRLLPRLRTLGIRRVDKVLISHGHRDHYIGLEALLKSEVSIGEVYFNLPPESVCRREADWGCKRDEIESLLRAVKGKGITVREHHAGDRIVSEGEVHLDVLYAFDGESTPVGPTDANDMSAILLLANRDTRALFTGDLNAAIGKYLAEREDPELKATILKVPHHGAEGVAPNAFFDWVEAQVALVPAPAPLWASDRDARVRRYFETHSVPTFVSGRDGLVRVVLYPDRFEVFKNVESE